MKNYINKEICSHCKLCIEVCPCNCIETNTQDEIVFIAERESICLKCSQCMAVCPSKAVQIERQFRLTEYPIQKICLIFLNLMLTKKNS